MERVLPESLRVVDEEINLICKDLDLPLRLKYEWDNSSYKGINWSEFLKDTDKREAYFKEINEIEAKTENCIKEIATELNKLNVFWTKLVLDPTNNGGASYIFIECFRKDDVLSQRHISAPNDWVYSSLKPPERMKVQISKVGKVFIYGTDKSQDEEISAATANLVDKQIWGDIEQCVLKHMKEAGFYLLTVEQLLKPFLYEFDKDNPTHSEILESNIIAKTRQPILYDFFFWWVD